MKISSKLQKLVDQKIISEDQAEKIMLSEQSKHSVMAWKLMYWIAGLFIGLGFILIVGSNWDDIPAPLKLLGDFALWALILFGTYQSVVNKKEVMKELFLTISFFFVGATIGLISQTFNLSGGWQSFAVAWAVLSLGFVVFSRMITLNLIWLYLFFYAVHTEYIIRFIEELYQHNVITMLTVGTIFFAMLTYAGDQLYKALNKIIVLPKAFAIYSLIMMYSIAFVGGATAGFDNVFANIFVFIFLGCRLLLAVYTKNMKSFIRNTHLVELFILFLFVTRFGDLFISGMGFIYGGVLLLGILYLLRKTSKYIKTMEAFHE